MIILFSPSKSQSHVLIEGSTFQSSENIFFPERTLNIIKKLKDMDKSEIQKVLKISPALSEKIFILYKKFELYQYNENNSRPAIFSYKGSAYKSLSPETLNFNNIRYLQNFLLILSPLCGLLKPLNLVQEYRLEMTSKININGLNLLRYWSGPVTQKINELSSNKKSNSLVNLSSNQYFKTINLDVLHVRLINITFLNHHRNEYKNIGLYSKKARGMMLRFLSINNIHKCEDIKSFSEQGYSFSKEISSDTNYIFTRKVISY